MSKAMQWFWLSLVLMAGCLAAGYYDGKRATDRWWHEREQFLEVRWHDGWLGHDASVDCSGGSGGVEKHALAEK